MIKFSLTAVYALLLFISPGVAISQVIEFEDQMFLESLIEAGVDINADGQISEQEAQAVDSLILVDKGISMMKEIKHFVNLRKLDCSRNEVVRLLLSKFGDEQSISSYVKNQGLEKEYTLIHRAKQLDLF